MVRVVVRVVIRLLEGVVRRHDRTVRERFGLVLLTEQTKKMFGNKQRMGREGDSLRFKPTKQPKVTVGL